MKKIFVMAVAAAMIFASCAKNENGGRVEPDGAESRMGISFTLPTGAATRATDIPGVGKEDDVNDITVFIFDGSGNAVLGNGTSFEVTVGEEGNFTVEDNTYTLKAENEIETTAGSRNVYLAANLPEGFTAATEPVLKAKKLQMATEAETAESIVMFSDVISKTITAIELDEDATPTQGQKTENAEANRVSAPLKRVVAKVVVSSATTLTQAFTGEGDGANFNVVYSVLGWGIHNSLSTTYAVEGAKTTGDYLGFVAGPLAKTLTTTAATTTTASEFAYVAENKPTVNGDLTYALIQTKAAPAKVAKVESGEIVWAAPADELEDMWVVKSVDNKFFFCESADIAEDVAEILAEDGEVKTAFYPGCYVYFTVYLNHTGSEKAGVIARNEFIHINLTGVKPGNFFGGTPGGEPDGDEPGDPDDDIFDPFDPDEPITKEAAFLTIDVTVADWVYDTVDTILE